jgi:hypothetical protein
MEALTVNLIDVNLTLTVNKFKRGKGENMNRFLLNFDQNISG